MGTKCYFKICLPSAHSDNVPLAAQSQLHIRINIAALTRLLEMQAI
jgi:hypothetical protein